MTIHDKDFIYNVGENGNFVVSALGLDTFKVKLAELNNKLGKAGFEPVAHTIKKSIIENSRGELVERFNITVSAYNDSFSLKGFEYIGFIKITDGIKAVYNFSNDSTVSLKDCNIEYCDHCHSTRYRTLGHIFKNTNNGKIEVIGSSCVESYLGIQVYKYLNILLGFGFDPEEFGGNYKGDNSLVFTRDLLESVYIMTSGCTGWDKGTSKEDILSHFNSPEIDHKGRQKKHIDSSKVNELFDIVEKFYKTFEVKSDFDFSCFTGLCHNDDKSLRYKVVPNGVTIWGIYNAINKINQLQVNSNNSEWLGNVDDKIEAEVTLIKKASFQSAYGVSYVLTLSDNKGNIITSFTTGAITDKAVGDKLRVKGTIKKLDVYNNVKQTVLTRIKAL